MKIDKKLKPAALNATNVTSLSIQNAIQTSKLTLHLNRIQLTRTTILLLLIQRMILYRDHEIAHSCIRI